MNSIFLPGTPFRSLTRGCSLGACFVLATLLATSALAETREYDWLTAGEVSGSLKLEVGEKGQRDATFEFNDRGRGPKISEKVTLGDDGLPSAIQVSGNSYMGAPVDEQFEYSLAQSRWRSTLEQGESDVRAFYLANDGTPEQLALLARTLLQQPEQKMPLLPAGEASLRQLTQVTIPGLPHQAHADGRLGHPNSKPEKVTLYAVSGLGLSPQYLWMDEHNELYALAFGWMGLAPKGRADALEQLQKVQEAEADKFQRQLAFELTEKLPQNWLIRNVNVVDVENGQLLENQVVAVRDGRIIRVAEDNGVDIPQGGNLQPRVIDGQGLSLLPGLWDMHSHLSLEDGLLHMAAGVTTVRDLANDADRLAAIRTAFDSGDVIGPRSYIAGFIDAKSPYSAPTGKLAENLPQALEMVREYAAAGYPQIKIYSSIDPDWVPPLAEEIHRNGMRLSGHIPSYMTAEQAVRDGFDEIQHINMVFLNFLAGPKDDTRTPLRFTLVAERGAELDLDSAAVNDFIALLKEKNVVVDPTVTIFEGMMRNKAGEIDPSYAMVAEHFPPELQRSLLAGELDINAENEARYSASADALLGMIKRLHDAGIRLVAGTDALAGFTLHRELELYVQAGISTADVLRLATLGSAEVADAAADSGSIAEGKRADFVLLAGNPLQDISAVRKSVAVFKGDRWYDSARLYEAVGIRPFTR